MLSLGPIRWPNGTLLSTVMINASRCRSGPTLMPAEMSGDAVFILKIKGFFTETFRKRPLRKFGKGNKEGNRYPGLKTI